MADQAEISLSRQLLVGFRAAVPLVRFAILGASWVWRIVTIARALVVACWALVLQLGAPLLCQTQPNGRAGVANVPAPEGRGQKVPSLFPRVEGRGGERKLGNVARGRRRVIRFAIAQLRALAASLRAEQRELLWLRVPGPVVYEIELVVRPLDEIEKRLLRPFLLPPSPREFLLAEVATNLERAAKDLQRWIDSDTFESRFCHYDLADEHLPGAVAAAVRNRNGHRWVIAFNKYHPKIRWRRSEWDGGATDLAIILWHEWAHIDADSTGVVAKHEEHYDLYRQDVVLAELFFLKAEELPDFMLPDDPEGKPEYGKSKQLVDQHDEDHGSCCRGRLRQEIKNDLEVGKVVRPSERERLHKLLKRLKLETEHRWQALLRP